MNLKALKLLYPEQDQFGIEINTEAANQLKSIIPEQNVTVGSIFDFSPNQTWDLVLIKGVLITLILMNSIKYMKN